MEEGASRQGRGGKWWEKFPMRMIFRERISIDDGLTNLKLHTRKK